MWGVFHIILSVPQNNVLDLNNVMTYMNLTTIYTTLQMQVTWKLPRGCCTILLWEHNWKWLSILSHPLNCCSTTPLTPTHKVQINSSITTTTSQYRLVIGIVVVRTRMLETPLPQDRTKNITMRRKGNASYMGEWRAWRMCEGGDESMSYVQAWRWIFVGSMVDATRNIHFMRSNSSSRVSSWRHLCIIIRLGGSKTCYTNPPLQNHGILWCRSLSLYEHVGYSKV